MLTFHNLTRESHQRYLRFEFVGNHYQFRALPFGQLSSPRVFRWYFFRRRTYNASVPSNVRTSYKSGVQVTKPKWDSILKMIWVTGSAKTNLFWWKETPFLAQGGQLWSPTGEIYVTTDASKTEWGHIGKTRWCKGLGVHRKWECIKIYWRWKG